MTSFQQSCACLTSVFHAKENEKFTGVVPVFQMKKKISSKTVGRSDSSHFEEGQVKKEIRNSVGNCARASKHLCSVSGFSLLVLRYSNAPRCTTPRGRRGGVKTRERIRSSRGGGECLAGPVAVPAHGGWCHGGCEAKPPEADEEGGGVRREKSRLLALGAHTNA